MENASLRHTSFLKHESHISYLGDIYRAQYLKYTYTYLQIINMDNVLSVNIDIYMSFILAIPYKNS